MGIADDIDQVAEHAIAAMSDMKRLRIAPSPNNYAIWYHYHASTYPDLRKTLDILLKNDQEFTPKRNEEIYQKFFGAQDVEDRIEGTREKLETQIDQVLKHLKVMGGSAKSYGKTLEDHSKQISEAKGVEDLQTAISGVLAATREMETRNQALEKQLAASTREVHSLRKDLDVVRQEALTDGLTGIPNRKVFDAALRSASTEVMERGDDLCLLMVDIDHFKNFNDTYGHQVGDQVLKVLAQVLVSCVKEKDTAARYGGEEFGVILPHTEIDKAKKVAEDIRAKVAAKTLVNRKSGEKMGKLSVTIGVGVFSHGEPLTKLIERADSCLYVGKRRGRNRVVGEDELTAAEKKSATAAKK